METDKKSDAKSKAADTNSDAEKLAKTIKGIPAKIGLAENYFRKSVFVAFYWIMFGVCVIYGIRYYHDYAIHPSFIPIVFVCFSVVTSFIVVLTLDYIAGEIKFKFPGMEFEGASGPIVLWVICFLAISLTLSSIDKDINHENLNREKGISVGELLFPSKESE